jgi:hypothetical protein
MPNLYDILSDAQRGDAFTELGNEFGLTPQQTQAAVAALLPAISVGIKRATETPEGLGNLLALMGSQPDLHAMYDDPQAAFTQQGRTAGNQVLSAMFGSPDASRAVTDQAQQLSGVTSSILKKLLPILAGMIISGLMRSRAGEARPSAPKTPAADQGGGLGDILRQIFKQGGTEASGQATSTPSAPSKVPAPGGGGMPDLGPGRGYRVPEGQSDPSDTDDSPLPGGGDVLGQIMRELEKAMREGRLKPVVVGPFEIDIPQQQQPAGSGQPPTPGGDILGQILRDILSGKGGRVQMPRQALTGGMGSAVFGNRLEVPNVSQKQIDNIQRLLDQSV